MVKVSAPGNLFFGGEHAVVYGRPALIGAPDRRTTVVLTPRGDGRVRVVSPTYGEFEDGVGDLLIRQFPDAKSYAPGKSEIEELTADELLNPARDVIGVFGRKYGLGDGFDAEITSTVARCGGMSSSTAFSVALYGALTAQIKGVDVVDEEEFWRLAYEINKKIHGGKASGAEANSSIRGGFHKARIEVVDGNPVARAERLRDIQPFSVVVGETGVRTQTKKTVPYVGEGRRNAMAAYEAVFDQIGRLAEEEVVLLTQGDLVGVGQRMDVNHELLARELGVSHPSLNRLVDVARRAGAYGAKMAGGGKGGLMIALVDPDSLDIVARAIQGAGGTAYKTVLGGEGLRVED